MVSFKRITGSRAFRLAVAEQIELLKTAGIIGLGAAAAYLSEQQFDLTTTEGIVTASAVTLLLHFARKFGFDTRDT